VGEGSREGVTRWGYRCALRRLLLAAGRVHRDRAAGLARLRRRELDDLLLAADVGDADHAVLVLGRVEDPADDRDLERRRAPDDGAVRQHLQGARGADLVGHAHGARAGLVELHARDRADRVGEGRVGEVVPLRRLRQLVAGPALAVELEDGLGALAVVELGADEDLLLGVVVVDHHALALDGRLAPGAVEAEGRGAVLADQVELAGRPAGLLVDHLAEGLDDLLELLDRERPQEPRVAAQRLLRHRVEVAGHRDVAARRLVDLDLLLLGRGHAGVLDVEHELRVAAARDVQRDRPLLGDALPHDERAEVLQVALEPLQVDDGHRSAP